MLSDRIIDVYKRQGYVVINGVKAPLVGVICMDQCMADVTDVPDIIEGMEAIIYGDGADGSMTIAEAAALAGTNKNDIIGRIPARPPRVYPVSYTHLLFPYISSTVPEKTPW